MCVFGVKRNVDENVEELAKKLIQGSEGLGMYDVTVVRATRGGVRDTKQGILKIELKSENEKIVVLRNKHRFTDIFKGLHSSVTQSCRTGNGTQHKDSVELWPQLSRLPLTHSRGHHNQTHSCSQMLLHMSLLTDSAMDHSTIIRVITLGLHHLRIPSSNRRQLEFFMTHHQP